MHELPASKRSLSEKLDWIGLSCYTRDAAVGMACEARLGLKHGLEIRLKEARKVGMACEARLGLKHGPAMAEVQSYHRRNGLRSPSGIETGKVVHARNAVLLESEWPAKPVWD